MIYFKIMRPAILARRLFQVRSLCSQMYVEQLKKRTVLKLTGPDTLQYLQSMITNDVRKIEDCPAIYSLLLNSNGKVLYDILLYKINGEEYLVEYDRTAVEHLHKHLLMYRLRKKVKIEPTTEFLPWVIYPSSDIPEDDYKMSLNSLVQTLNEKDEIITSVIDPRTDLLGVRVLTKRDVSLIPILTKNSSFSEGDSYGKFRYKLGIGEGVQDHPPGVSLPTDTNFDYMNGVSFSKGCYIGQELSARLNFVSKIVKRLMPVVLEEKEVYPEFAPEARIVNLKGERVGRLRNHLGQYGLALLKYEECLKAKDLVLKEYNVKLTVTKPKFWPEN